MTKELDEVCGNCGLRFGSHHAGHGKYPYNCCPGHEGRMDWDEGAGTTFIPTGKYADMNEIPLDTPANNIKEL